MNKIIFNIPFTDFCLLITVDEEQKEDVKDKAFRFIKDWYNNYNGNPVKPLIKHLYVLFPNLLIELCNK